MSPFHFGRCAYQIAPPLVKTSLNKAITRFIPTITGSIHREKIIILFLLITSMAHTTTVYSIPDSPCNCTSFTIIGSPNTETEISSLTGGLASNTCYFIRGTLVIDVPTFLSSVRLRMDEGSLIRADSGLIVMNSYIAGCDVLWQGIRVNAPNNISMFYSKIKAANIGIRMEGNTGIACQFNEFIDNYVGISVGDPLEANPTEMLIEQKEPVLGCKFYTASESLPDPYQGHPYFPSWPTHSTIPYDKGYAGIFVFGASGLHIGKKNANLSERNEIYQMRNGIVLNNSISNITGTDIHDLEGGLTGEDDPALEDLNQMGIYSQLSLSEIFDNTMEDLLFGINSIFSSHAIHHNTLHILKTPNERRTRGIYALNPQTLSIVDNDITNGWRGIMLEQVNNSFEILKNTLERDFATPGNVGIYVLNQQFTGDQTGLIRQNEINITDGNGAYGIQLNATHGFIVGENIINYVVEESHNFQNQGIGCSGSIQHRIQNNQINADPEYIDLSNRGIAINLSGNNTVSCNSVENMQTDLYFLGQNVMTKVERNELDDAEFGLYLVSPVFLGTQDHHNNQWIGEHSEFGAFIYDIVGGNPLTSALMSLFIVDSGDNSNFLPETIGPEEVEDVWFIDELGPTGTVCLGNPPPDPDLNADTLVKFLLAPIEFDRYDEELQWMLKADIYEMILSDPSLNANSTLDSFYNVEFYNPLGRLVTWQLALKSRFGIEEVEKKLTEDTLIRLATDLMFIDSVLETEPINIATWVNLRALKTDTLSLKLELWHGLLSDENMATIEEHELLADSIYNLSPGSFIEDYFRIALLLKVNHLLGNSFIGADSADILELATLCPFEGGRAVVVGQELHSIYFDSLVFIDPDNCIEVLPFSVKPESPVVLTGEINVVITFPNPGRDQIWIQSTEEIMEIYAHDALGRLIWMDTPNKHAFYISTDYWQGGTYFLRVVTSSSKQILKLSILK